MDSLRETRKKLRETRSDKFSVFTDSFGIKDAQL